MKTKDYAAAVRQMVTAQQAAEAIGLKADRRGMCKCPLHGDKTASLKLYPGNRGWYCFGCHQGGSVLDLVMAYYGMDLMGAVEFLNKELSLGLPIGYTPTREQEAQAKAAAMKREEERKAREAAEREKNEAFQRYCDLGREIAQMELDMKEFAPKAGDEEWDGRFVTALREIDQKKDEAERLALLIFGKEEGT